MPQLDINIIFIEFFFGFLLFWSLYFYNNKFIFPEINRILKLRQLKIFDLKYKIVYLQNIYFLYEKINNFQYTINKNSNLFSFEQSIKHNVKQIKCLALLLNSKLFIKGITKTNNFPLTIITSKYYL